MNKKEFIEKYCKDCKEPCEEGIVETNEYIYCIDIDKKEFKKIKNVNKF